jgi:hypothetical protein
MGTTVQSMSQVRGLPGPGAGQARRTDSL